MTEGTLLMMLLFSVIYTSLTFGSLTAGIAKRYGRDIDTWAILGGLLGPLALALLYFNGRKGGGIILHVSDDEKRKWEALKRADKHIALAAARAKEVSESCERDLLLMYFAVNDRAQLPHLLATAVEAAEIRKKKTQLDSSSEENKIGT